MTKRINVQFEEDEHKTLLAIKGKLSWHDFIMQLGPDAPRGDYLKTVAEKEAEYEEGDFTKDISLDESQIDEISDLIHDEEKYPFFAEKFNDVVHKETKENMTIIRYSGQGVIDFIHRALDYAFVDIKDFELWLSTIVSLAPAMRRGIVRPHLIDKDDKELSDVERKAKDWIDRHRIEFPDPGELEILAEQCRDGNHVLVDGFCTRCGARPDKVE